MRTVEPKENRLLLRFVYSGAVIGGLSGASPGIGTNNDFA
jgi:hypothetical protein